MFIFAESIEYLDREIDERGVRPGRRMAEALVHMDKPRSVAHVQQFLRLVSYFRKIIENLAS